MLLLIQGSCGKQNSWNYIRALRNGRGVEYISNDVLLFYREHGILYKFTTRYTPQENGISKRKIEQLRKWQGVC